MSLNYDQIINRDPEIMGGVPVFTGPVCRCNR